MRDDIGRPDVDEPDHWLPSVRRERPHSSAAEQRDEVAPPQVDHATTSQWADHGILSLQ
jgi:hypothetical protein